MATSGKNAGQDLVGEQARAADESAVVVGFPSPVPGADMLEAILSASSDAVCVTDRDHRFLYVNRAAEDVLAHPRAALLGRTGRELGLPVDFAGAAESLLTRAMATGRVVTGATVVETARGAREYEFEYRSLPGGAGGGGAAVLAVYRDVTEYARAKRASDEAVAQLRLITNAVPLLISYVGQDLRYRFVNEGYSAWFGAPAEQIVGKTVPEVIGQAAYEAARPRIEAALAGERLTYEATLPYDEGQHPRHVHADMIPDRGGDGEVRGFVAVITDNTARHDAEEAQRAAAEAARRKGQDLEAVLASVTDGFMAWDRQWRFTYVNAEGARILGRPAADLIGHGVLELFPELEGTSFFRAYATAMAENRVVEITDYYPPFDTWFEVRAYPSEAGLSLYLRDIAARLRSEAALRGAEERLRLATEAASVGTFDFDPVAGTLVWDVRCKELFGLPPDAPVDYSVFLAGVHEDDRDRMDAEVRRVLEPSGTGELDTEYRITGFGGGETAPVRWVEARGRTFFDKGRGRALRFIGTVLDVTERKQREGRERFLTELTERVRPLLDPDDVLYEAARLVGEFTGASRALFGEVDDAPGGDPDAATVTVHRDFVQAGVPSIAGLTRPLLSFGREIIENLRAGQVTASEDILNDARVRPEDRAAFAELGIRAFVGTPIHKAGRWVSLLVLHHDRPRPWPPEERALLAAVSERALLAVDNARLYRDRMRGAERLRLAVEASGLGAWEMDLTAGATAGDAATAVNTFDARTAALFGRDADGVGVAVVGTGWADWIHPEDRARILADFAAALRSGAGEYARECRALWPDGKTVRWLALRAAVQRDGPTGVALRVIGVVRDVTEEKEASARQRRFLREMLFGLTEGHLRLCDTEADLPVALPPACDPVALSAPALRGLRGQAESVAEELRFPKERVHDLLTAVSEAATNAVRHAVEGEGRVHADPASGVVQVWVRDRGEGIAEHLIHRAVEQGWTTGGFGSGFFLMMRSADRVYLLTGEGGTTVVLEQDREPPIPLWMQGG